MPHELCLVMSFKGYCIIGVLRRLFTERVLCIFPSIFFFSILLERDLVWGYICLVIGLVPQRVAGSCLVLHEINVSSGSSPSTTVVVPPLYGLSEGFQSRMFRHLLGFLMFNSCEWSPVSSFGSLYCEVSFVGSFWFPCMLRVATSDIVCIGGGKSIISLKFRTRIPCRNGVRRRHIVIVVLVTHG